MKRIGYVLADFPVLSETFVLTEMHAMQALGHHVRALVLGRLGESVHELDAPYIASASTLPKVSLLSRLRALCSRGLPRAVRFVLQQRRIPLWSLLWNGAGLAAMVRRADCQHLHAHFAHSATSHAVVAARLAGISVSFVGHGFDVYADNAEIDTKLRHVDFAVAVCRDMLRFFRSKDAGTRTSLIHCGVDTDRFGCGQYSQQTRRLLFVGRLVEKKGCATLLRALALIPATTRPQLDIVGDGPLRATLEALTISCGLRRDVRFLGAQSNSWLVRHGSEYSALVAPFQLASNGDRDTGPVVAKEAMALGLPVIASDFMGLSEIVQHGRCGLLVPPKDAVALARTIRHFLALQPQQRARMCQLARERVERLFDARHSATRLSCLVEAA